MTHQPNLTMLCFLLTLRQQIILYLNPSFHNSMNQLHLLEHLSDHTMFLMIGVSVLVVQVKLDRFLHRVRLQALTRDVLLFVHPIISFEPASDIFFSSILVDIPPAQNSPILTTIYSSLTHQLTHV